MKKTTIAAALYCITAVLIYLAALFTLVCSHNIGAGIVLGCGGSAMLCLGGALMNRPEDENTQQQG